MTTIGENFDVLPTDRSDLRDPSTQHQQVGTFDKGVIALGIAVEMNSPSDGCRQQSELLFTDGPAVLRQTAKQWANSYYSRAVCVSTLRWFFEFTYRDPLFKFPETWLIDEFHAKHIHGEKPEKVMT